MKFIFQTHTLKNEPRKVLILDRDGVVVKDTGYPHKEKDIVFEEENIKKIKYLIKKNKFDICGFATNQSGVGRKFFSEIQFWECHYYIIKSCLLRGLNIDFTAVNFFIKSSYYRKPKPGMLDQVKSFYSIDDQNILFIGDKSSDKEAAKNANVNYKNIYECT